ncbi:uncharacterized protein JCM15063_002304 [Sporobolomyces koalae]|uniref:uncharacterized protein n=1 Tax=Sporobolomyces koalae TaxID=500713 RepID=UPI00316ECDA5
MRGFTIAALFPLLATATKGSFGSAGDAGILARNVPASPLLVASTAETAPISVPSVHASATEDFAFNTSSRIRAPRATDVASHRNAARYYWGPTIIQDPQPSDTASQPPIGGDHSTPNPFEHVTYPSFPPRSSASSTQPEVESPTGTVTSPIVANSTPPSSALTSTTSSESQAPESADAPSSSSILQPTSLSHLAENRARRQKAWTSYTSDLARLSRLSVEAESPSLSPAAEVTQWTKIRDYRDKIVSAHAGHERLRRVVRRKKQ